VEIAAAIRINLRELRKLTAQTYLANLFRKRGGDGWDFHQELSSRTG
jgi:hypothetical protein